MRYIGWEGALFIWAALFWLLCWPLIVVSIFMWLKRRSLAKKWLFSIAGVGLCYLAQLVVTLVTNVATSGSPPPDPDVLGWQLGLSQMAQLLLSIVALVLLSRKFRENVETVPGTRGTG